MPRKSRRTQIARLQSSSLAIGLLKKRALRFPDLQDRVQAVPLERVAEDGVQANALRRILDDRFAVEDLRNSISSIGFQKVDRLVVTQLPLEGKYVVREGNRRLGAPPMDRCAAGIAG
jgi:hypothetical protein